MRLLPSEGSNNLKNIIKQGVNLSNKFKNHHWKIIRYYCEGWIGELHHFIKGQREEALTLVIPMSVAEHGVQFNHAKNYSDSTRVPREIKLNSIKFWKELMSPSDYQYFIDTGHAWI